MLGNEVALTNLAFLSAYDGESLGVEARTSLLYSRWITGDLTQVLNVVEASFRIWDRSPDSKIRDQVQRAWDKLSVLETAYPSAQERISRISREVLRNMNAPETITESFFAMLNEGKLTGAQQQELFVRFVEVATTWDLTPLQKRACDLLKKATPEKKEEKAEYLKEVQSVRDRLRKTVRKIVPETKPWQLELERHKELSKKREVPKEPEPKAEAKEEVVISHPPTPVWVAKNLVEMINRRFPHMPSTDVEEVPEEWACKTEPVEEIHLEEVFEQPRPVPEYREPTPVERELAKQFAALVASSSKFQSLQKMRGKEK